MAIPLSKLLRRPTPRHKGAGSNDGAEDQFLPIEWRLVKQCLSLLRPYRTQYLIGITLCSIHVLLDMTGPAFIGHVVNYVVKFMRTAPPDVDIRPAMVYTLMVLGVWAVVATLSMILQRRVILIMTRAGESVQFDLRQRLFAHMQTLSMSYFDRTKLGRIIGRNTSDVNALRDVNVWGLNRLLMISLQVVVAAFMLCWTDWRIFAAVAPLGALLLILNTYFRRTLAHASQVVREGFTKVSTNLAENITGMRVVTAFNRQSPNLNIFNTLQTDNTANNVWNARLVGIYQSSLMGAQLFGRIIILGYGGYLVYSGRIEGVGDIAKAYLYWNFFMDPILDLGNLINQLMTAMASAERVFHLLGTKPEVTDVADAQPLPRITGHVEFDRVTFGYDAKRPVLHDVSFTAKPGQMVALVGHTGSGKSSIVSLIARFYQPQEGRVQIDGRDIRLVTSNSLHRQTGLVLQNNYLFTGTVMENICYGRAGASCEQVYEAARAIGSYDAIAALPSGFDTEVGERGGAMSLGQRQLICFTRAFLADPRIFMLDEATSAVDTGTELVIQNSLEKLLVGRTTFVVAHRLSTIVKSDLILVLENGRIIERGTHDELVGARGKYAHLYEQFATLA